MSRRQAIRRVLGRFWTRTGFGADLSGADLSGADLRDANLSRAEVTDEQLASATSLKGAIMPNGTEHD